MIICPKILRSWSWSALAIEILWKRRLMCRKSAKVPRQKYESSGSTVYEYTIPIPTKHSRYAQELTHLTIANVVEHMLTCTFNPADAFRLFTGRTPHNKHIYWKVCRSSEHLGKRQENHTYCLVDTKRSKCVRHVPYCQQIPDTCVTYSHTQQVFPVVWSSALSFSPTQPKSVLIMMAISITSIFSQQDSKRHAFTLVWQMPLSHIFVGFNDGSAHRSRTPKYSWPRIGPPPCQNNNHQVITCLLCTTNYRPQSNTDLVQPWEVQRVYQCWHPAQIFLTLTMKCSTSKTAREHVFN